MELRFRNSYFGTRIAYQIPVPLVQITMGLRIQNNPRSQLGRAVKSSKFGSSLWSPASQDHSCQSLMCRGFCQFIVELRIRKSCLSRRIADCISKSKSHLADSHATLCPVVEAESRRKCNVLNFGPFPMEFQYPRKSEARPRPFKTNHEQKTTGTISFGGVSQCSTRSLLAGVSIAICSWMEKLQENVDLFQ